MENMDKGLTVPKWLLINLPKVPQMPQIYLPKPKNLVSFRTFRCPLLTKPVTVHELLFAVSYSKPALGTWYNLLESFQVCTACVADSKVSATAFQK